MFIPSFVQKPLEKVGLKGTVYKVFCVNKGGIRFNSKKGDN